MIENRMFFVDGERDRHGALMIGGRAALVGRNRHKDAESRSKAILVWMLMSQLVC